MMAKKDKGKSALLTLVDGDWPSDIDILIISAEDLVKSKLCDTGVFTTKDGVEYEVLTYQPVITQYRLAGRRKGGK